MYLNTWHCDWLRIMVNSKTKKGIIDGVGKFALQQANDDHS